MARTTTKPTKATPPKEINAQAYNAFVANVRPVRIELTELSAKTTRSDAAEVTLQVESRFVVACPKQDDVGFTVEARLELRFLTDVGEEVGHVQCAYHLQYQADMSLSEGLLEQFSSVNAPMNVWPFMRELVMGLTQRFGWSGFVLPSFLIPPRAASAGESVPPVKKSRKTVQSTKKT